MKIVGYFAGLAMIAAIGSCGDGNDPIGRCTEDRCDGEIEIVEIKDADPTGNSCQNDPVEVKFDYHSSCQSVGTGISGWLFTVSPRAGKHPPRDWLTQQGIAVGKRYTAVYIDHGPCPPTWESSGIDFALAQSLCQ